MSRYDSDKLDDQDMGCIFDGCDDPDCLFCQSDDGDAAFWDEFMSEPENNDYADPEYSLHLIDKNSGEELVFSNLNIKPFTVLKYN